MHRYIRTSFNRLDMTIKNISGPIKTGLVPIMSAWTLFLFALNMTMRPPTSHLVHPITFLMHHELTKNAGLK